MKTLAFWALDATVLFVLSLVYFHQGYHRKNQLFAAWLCNGVTMQLVAAWSLAAGRPLWISHLRAADDVVEYVLTAGVLVMAVMRRDCPVNRSLLWGLGAMVALRALSIYLGERVEHSVQVWLRNVAFFGPAIFLLIALSNIRLDRLPLWITSSWRVVGARWAEGGVLTAAGVLGMRRGSRR